MGSFRSIPDNFACQVWESFMNIGEGAQKKLVPFNWYQIPHGQDEVLPFALLTWRKHIWIHAVIDHLGVCRSFTQNAIPHFVADAYGFCGRTINPLRDSFAPVSPNTTHLVCKESIESMDCHYKGNPQFIRQLKSRMSTRKRRM